MRAKLLILISYSSLISCSPLYTLFVQNNTDKPIEIYVQLKNEKYTQNSKKTLEKRVVYNYKKLDNIDEIAIDSLTFYLKANKLSERRYSFTSNLNYNFSLDPRALISIDPSNSISIYPFEKIYYVQDDKKCFVVPKITTRDCTYKIFNKKKFKNNKTVKEYADFIEIENLK